jgi:hypothetical protein
MCSHIIALDVMSQYSPSSAASGNAEVPKKSHTSTATGPPRVMMSSRRCESEQRTSSNMTVPKPRSARRSSSATTGSVVDEAW